MARARWWPSSTSTRTSGSSPATSSATRRCRGLDAMWQLVGFFLGWSGAPGRGRALGVGDVKFSGQVTTKIRKVTYRIDLKKVILRRLVLGVGDGILEADGA